MSLVVVLGPRFRGCRSAGLAGVPVAYTLERATRCTVQIIVRGDTGGPCSGSARPSSLVSLPRVRQPPFFAELLGQLELHYKFADLGTGHGELPFLRLPKNPRAADPGTNDRPPTRPSPRRSPIRGLPPSGSPGTECPRRRAHRR